VTAAELPAPRDRLAAWSLFAGVLSAAGLPIYLFAPAYYAQTYGVSLTTLGLLLFGLRLFDVVQDPALGWLAERLGPGKPLAVAVAGVLLALSMLGLFAVTPPIQPLWWFALTITGLFTAYSFLAITFYGQGVAKAGGIVGGHVRLAAWRESGGLLGTCIAAVAPTVLLLLTGAPYAAFAWGFAGLVALAVLMMRREWTPGGGAIAATPLRDILADRVARRLLVLAMVNAVPLAVSSTLFLFFVQGRLQAPGWEGPMLVLFFLCAALSSPVWSRLARTYGEKPVLLAGMVIAIPTFGWALLLGAGDLPAFGVVCVLSGAVIGADLTLLPAMFSRRMARIAPNGGQGFGLWAFMNKLSLAFAAVLLLPLLERVGFVPGQPAPAEALTLLSLLYAGLPCALKLLAIGLLAMTRLED